MVTTGDIKREFGKYGGVLKTAELNQLGLSSRQIKRLIEGGVVSRIKKGFYELNGYTPRAEVVIARLFPQAVVFLESALSHYGYTDRIPRAWQIAVDKNSSKPQYKLDYPRVEPYYLEPKFTGVGVDLMEIDGVMVRIYDRDRTICDVLRYERKLEKEVFNTALQRYVKDSRKNIRRLFDYADKFSLKRKVQTYIGVWL